MKEFLTTFLITFGVTFTVFWLRSKLYSKNIYETKRVVIYSSIALLWFIGSIWIGSSSEHSLNTVKSAGHFPDVTESLAKGLKNINEEYDDLCKNHKRNQLDKEKFSELSIQITSFMNAYHSNPNLTIQEIDICDSIYKSFLNKQPIMDELRRGNIPCW
jgi:hypothetical protein